jgi:putative Mn2+ efflux pump MntP
MFGGFKRMGFTFSFFFNSILLGIGLAMDAFSVSLANGLNEPKMKSGKMLGVAGIFSLFQFAMPMIGWVCVSTIAQYFTAFEKLIPWIALGLLGYIGGKMLIEAIKNKDSDDEKPAVGFGALLVQGVATSIDALSVGFTISDYNWIEALLSCTLIGLVTFFICFAGIAIGKKAGTKLANKAGILGGAILIFIGLEIFITSWF